MSTSRREFLRNTALASFGIGLLGSGAAGCSSTSSESLSETRDRVSGSRSVHDLTTTPVAKVRVGLIGLSRGMSHVHSALNTEFAEITVVCDLRKDRCESARKAVAKAYGKEPAVICGDDNAWEAMCRRDDVDVVIISTPWEWHVPMAVAAMEAGKHAFVEVSAAVSVADCWKLVDTSERTRKHCVMLENCCYGESELFVLNMARNGVFGELTHGEAAYIHNLREMLFSLGTEGDWRREYHKKFNGNLYPTHGLGPVAQYMGVNRGDRFKYIVSVSSPEIGLTKWRDEHKPNGGRHANEKYVTGDMNTSIIKTELGRTIMVQHDIISPRPYSRINALSGTGATFFGYEDRLAIDNPKQYGLDAHSGAHSWLSDKDLSAMKEKFMHPLIKRLKSRSKGAGHGGMDFVMLYRHLEAIRKGETPDSTVYDAAAWSSVLQLSTQSVSKGSAPIEFPDFTRGAWNKLSPLPIVS